MKVGKFNFGGFMACAIVLVGLAATTGWCMNIQNLFQYDVGSTEWIVSLVGVPVAFVGCVCGWVL